MENQNPPRRQRPDGERPPTDMQLLDIKHLIELLEISRSAIYLYMRTEGFPLPIRVGPRAVRWILSEVLEWVRRRRRGGPRSGE